MEIGLAVLSIAGAITIGAMSPGPSFVMVARTSVANSRADGLAAALGMGVGGLLFAGLAMLGLHAVLEMVPWLYMALKILGGAYLMFLGYLIWRDAKRPLVFAAERSSHATTLPRSFAFGLLTQLSNPKTAVVYASIFASLLPREIPLAAVFGIPLVIFLIEVGWYSVVALGLSAAQPRAFYLRSKAWLDRVTGGVMAMLGIKLIASARV